MVVKVTLYVPEKGDCFSHVTRTACIFCNSYVWLISYVPSKVLFLIQCLDANRPT